MRPLYPIAMLSLTLASTASMAQTPAPTPAYFPLPHAYSGYAQPEITNCTTVGALRRDCVVPAMTAGRYAIIAVDGATATGANATQTLSISLGGAPCAVTNAVPFTANQGLEVGCEVTLLADQPITVTATYAVQNGTPEPAGPKLVFRRQPWTGVIAARPFVPKAPPAKK